MTKKYLLLITAASLFLSGCINNSPVDQQSPPQETNHPEQKPSVIFEAENENGSQPNQDPVPSSFSGTKGETVVLKNAEIILDSLVFEDGQAHFYNTTFPSGKTIYFFVVKDKNGIYRAAANACQVCFDAQMGFRQEDNSMVCNTCGNKYPIEKIATEKGGCNPGPINPNLEVRNGQIIVKAQELEEVADFF